MIDHELYRELGALAASGQLESEELDLLLNHCQTCAACRQAVASFAQVSARLFIAPRVHTASSGQRLDRFKARAVREGVALGGEALPVWKPLLAAALVLFAVSFTTLLKRTRASSVHFAQTAEPQPAQDRRPGPSKALAVFVAQAQARPLVPTSTRRDPHGNAGARKTALRSKALPRSIAKEQILVAEQPAQPVFNLPRILATEIQADYLVPSHIAGGDAHARGSFLSVRLPGSALVNFTFPRQIDAAMALRSVSLAAGGRPSALDLSSRHYDFSANIRLLHFQIPTAQ